MLKNKKYYEQYVPGKTFVGAFETDKIPLMQMAHLRNLDYPVSRRISYERTVDEFLLQLAVNDSLHALKVCKDLVILLDREGALIREKGRWSLLFTPEAPEGASLAEDEDLYPVLHELLEKEKDGRVCRVAVPKRSMRALISGQNPFSILDEYCLTQPGGYLAIAEQIVFAGTGELYKHVPVCRCNALVTVDRDEIENYQTIRALLEDYIIQCDTASSGESVQPLSIAVFGPPGAGKSFGVKQIASTSGRFAVTSLNVSQYSSPSALFEALDEALKTPKDSIPLIFFDEFDSEMNGEPRGWLRYFLAPMQDGEYTLGGRTRAIDDAVFVFAGGTAESFDQFQPAGSDEAAAEAFRRAKGPDFVSRLKGILNIKGLNPVSVTDRSHIIRRAVLLREQIIRRVPGIYNADGGLINISRGLLSALLRVSEYRHGARSLEFILAMCRLSDVNRFTPSCLPMDEQLDIHLSVTDFRNKLAFEQVMGDAVEQYARIAHANFRRMHLPPVEKKKNSSPKQEQEDSEKAVVPSSPLAEQIAADPEISVSSVREAAEEAMPAEELSSAAEAVKNALVGNSSYPVEQLAEWKELDEVYKESYRSQIRFLGEALQSYDMEIGLRPVVKGSVSADSIPELYGPVLERFAAMEHDRWMHDKEHEGWVFGEDNPDLKRSPEMIPYDELDEKTRARIRIQVREIPGQLGKIGYELYYKYGNPL